ncbi:MAG: LysR family transcriptional regulator [Deltaproteobacteria bacterium]|nr:LysR family transcriptional regulator [Deltaproteobacteria bacterium]
MKPWINYHHLLYFKTIASEGSIARAAETLRLGQPTLSAQLKQFEDTIGVKLFERQHKKLVLNEAGRMALRYANEIFRTGDEMLAVLHDRLVPTRTHVQIAALDSVPKHLTLAVVQAAYKIGDCMVTVLEGKGDELVRELALHQIDLFISNYVPSTHEARGLYSRSIAKVPVSLCAAAKFKSLQAEFPNSLAKAPMILPTAHSRLRDDLEHYFKTAEITMDVIAETQDTTLQKFMAVDGIGIIPIPTFAAEDLIRAGQLVVLGQLPGVYEEFYLVAAARKIENPVSSQIMKSFHL